MRGYVLCTTVRERLRRDKPKEFCVGRIYNQSGEPSWNMGLFKAQHNGHPTMGGYDQTGNCLLETKIVDDVAMFNKAKIESITGMRF